jgi:hypothetical protein
VLLADLETVQMHAAGGRYGGLGRLIEEAQGSLATVNLDILGRENADSYWARSARHDTVLDLTWGRPGAEALARVLESWVGHFLGVKVSVTPLARIEEPHWAWHVGLDAESTGILNDLWNGREVEAGRMRRIVALLRLTFDDPGCMRADLAGRPVVLALSVNDAQVVRMKPQNLLLNLPVATAS